MASNDFDGRVHKTATLTVSLFLLLSLAACGETPAQGFDAFLVAAKNGNKAEAFARFSRDSRTGMVDLAARGDTGGLSPEEFLFTQFEVQPVEHIVEISRERDKAVIELIHLNGKTARVPMVREDGKWRIEALNDSDGVP
jgi:hypothetical protein